MSRNISESTQNYFAALLSALVVLHEPQAEVREESESEQEHQEHANIEASRALNAQRVNDVATLSILGASSALRHRTPVDAVNVAVCRELEPHGSVVGVLEHRQELEPVKPARNGLNEETSRQHGSKHGQTARYNSFFQIH